MKRTLLFLLLLPLHLLGQVDKGTEPLIRQTAFSGTGVTWALIAGVSNYQDPAITDLSFADKDALAFATFLRSNSGGALDSTHLKIMTNQEATSANFWMELTKIARKVEAGDQVIIYFSGHGDVESLTEEGYLLFWDALDRAYVTSGALAVGNLKKIMQSIVVKSKAKAILITDACRSGTLAGGLIGAQMTNEALQQQIENDIRFLSCGPKELSKEGMQWGGGRGAFSYYLLNGLYGLADNMDVDSVVTLFELRRYLEDAFRKDSLVAKSQKPQIIAANDEEKMSILDPAIFSELKKGVLNQMAVMAPISKRGPIDEMLARMDSSSRLVYYQFLQAIKENRLMEPEGNCAETYLQKILQNPQFADIHYDLKYDYAAALQNDAQQVINIWLKADVQELHCIGKSLKLDQIHKKLERAAELIGEDQIMYKPLKARQYLFEGAAISFDSRQLEKMGARHCMDLYKKSLALEPNSAVVWLQMADLYARNLNNYDSAFICARQAKVYSPKWVLPYIALSYILASNGKMELAERSLQEAQKIDPTHPLVSNRKAALFVQKGGLDNLQKALELFEQYRQSGGSMYPCWHNNYARVLADLGKLDQAKEQANQALSIDSTNQFIWQNLGGIYSKSKNWPEAEKAYKKALELDPKSAEDMQNLALVYTLTDRYREATILYQQALAIEPNNASVWNRLGMVSSNDENYKVAESAYQMSIKIKGAEPVPYSNLGKMYMDMGRMKEAESNLKQAIAIDPKFANPHRHLGKLYQKNNKPEAAEKSYLKALELDPKYANAMLGLASLYYTNGRNPEAIAYLPKAFENGLSRKNIKEDQEAIPMHSLPEWKELMQKYFPEN